MYSERKQAAARFWGMWLDSVLERPTSLPPLRESPFESSAADEVDDLQAVAGGDGRFGPAGALDDLAVLARLMAMRSPLRAIAATTGAKLTGGPGCQEAGGSGR